MEKFANLLWLMAGLMSVILLVLQMHLLNITGDSINYIFIILWGFVITIIFGMAYADFLKKN